MVKYFYVLLSFVACMWGCPSTGAKQAKQTQTLRVYSLTGKPLQWKELLKRKPRTLAIFMTTWCHSCKKKQPKYVDWANRNYDKVQTIFIVSGSSAKEVANIAKKRKIPSYLIRVVVDAKGNIAKNFDVRGTPTYIVLGNQGKILGRYAALKELP